MLLSNGMSESSQREVSIYDVSLDIFKRLVRYCYTFEFELNGLEDVYKVLEAADKFQLIKVCEKIFYTIRQEINEESVWQIWECADKYESNKTINACIRYISTHMKSVVESDAFLKANSDHIQCSFDAEIVNINDDDNSMDETKLYEAAVKWAKERKKEIEDKEDDNINKQFETDVATILESIRFSKIPVDYLVKNVEADDFIMNFSGIQKKVRSTQEKKKGNT
ncbi:MAG: hypothetical protein EXX96DRAFT_588775 [Benjaminiella poitrasii]|nr:MAG: hypothetical protein EXX96DRAFT_588775 [Benjaminiella poitrasii]